jgi:4-hydroxythreonine-4-phosphate dehydrogenase
MKPLIAISMGDHNGIGPEVILKALQKTDFKQSTPVLIGHEHVFQYYEEIVKSGFTFHTIHDIHDCISRANTINLLKSSEISEIIPDPGKITATAGNQAMKAVDTGASLCLNGDAHALVTAPISKESIHKAGFHYPGHTEFLAEKSNTEDIQMMLVCDNLRVALATIHIPVRSIAEQLDTPLVELHIEHLHQSLREDFDIDSPKLAVLALNPHAGDGGVIGNEEIEIIRPALIKAVDNGINAEGPFPADGFFGNRKWQEFDGVLAMYHDQGLIPFKTIAFGKGVNFTSGLSFIRTSPDHGTGFDIAGRNRASEKSFKAAYDLAVKLAVNKYTE